MNVVNRKRKMEERRGDGEVKGRTREREREGAVYVAKAYYWPVSKCDPCVCGG